MVCCVELSVLRNVSYFSNLVYRYSSISQDEGGVDALETALVAHTSLYQDSSDDDVNASLVSQANTANIHQIHVTVLMGFYVVLDTNKLTLRYLST